MLVFMDSRCPVKGMDRGTRGAEEWVLMAHDLLTGNRPQQGECREHTGNVLLDSILSSRARMS